MRELPSLKPTEADDIYCMFFVGRHPHRHRCPERAWWIVSDDPRGGLGGVMFACHGCITPRMRKGPGLAYLADGLRAALLAGGPRCCASDCAEPVTAWGDACDAHGEFRTK